MKMDPSSIDPQYVVLTFANSVGSALIKTNGEKVTHNYDASADLVWEKPYSVSVVARDAVNLYRFVS